MNRFSKCLLVPLLLLAACGPMDSSFYEEMEDDAPGELPLELNASQFVSPTANAIVSGSVKVEVRPPAAARKVTFYVSADDFAVDRDAPFTAVLDTTRLKEGEHKLRVNVRDAQSRLIDQSTILITVRRGAVTTPPVVVDAGVKPVVVDAGVKPVVVDAGVKPVVVDAGTSSPSGPVSSGIWISRAEVMKLPMSGPAWNALKAQADAPAGTPDLSNQDQMNNVYVMAKALVFARTGVESYRTEVRSQCMRAIDTELGGRTLAIGRELAAYVIAADLVGLEPSEDAQFRAWLKRTFTENLDGKTLVSTHEERPNNWGTHAGGSRIAAAAYLLRSSDAADRAFGQAQLTRSAQVFKGWLGDRAAYASFEYGDLSWQSNASAPVGVNPKGATKNGHSVDGAFPDDMRRGCSFQWPPCFTGYAWGAFEGATVQAEILHRHGYDAWNWSDKALLRAAQYLMALDNQFGGWWADGDDDWNPWVLNHVYGTSFPTMLPANPGKNMAWTDWTHDRSTRPRP